MKESTSWRMFWILMVLSVLTTGGYQIWNSQRPSDEEVQRRMQGGLKAKQQLEEAQAVEEKFKADQERILGTRANTDR